MAVINFILACMIFAAMKTIAEMRLAKRNGTREARLSIGRILFFLLISATAWLFIIPFVEIWLLGELLPNPVFYGPDGQPVN